MQWLTLFRVDIKQSNVYILLPDYDNWSHNMNKTRKDSNTFFETIRYKTYLSWGSIGMRCINVKNVT